MKYKTWLILDKQCDMKELNQWFLNQDYKVYTYFTKSPCILVDVDEQDVNYLKIACPFGLLTVLKKPVTTISGTYINAQGWDKTPTESFER